ncbi:MAG: hypothetical protein ACJAZY_003783 [Spirosomataceae bacterium]|jgi:hypothetical protein
MDSFSFENEAAIVTRSLETKLPFTKGNKELRILYGLTNYNF